MVNMWRLATLTESTNSVVKIPVPASLREWGSPTSNTVGAVERKVSDVWRIFFTVFLVVVCATVADSYTDEEIRSAARDASVCDDPIRVAELCRPLAERGNAVAAYHLAKMYDEGKGVPQNPFEALKWRRLAA